jgi:hypothetical protein
MKAPQRPATPLRFAPSRPVSLVDAAQCPRFCDRYPTAPHDQHTMDRPQPTPAARIPRTPRGPATAANDDRSSTGYGSAGSLALGVRSNPDSNLGSNFGANLGSDVRSNFGSDFSSGFWSGDTDVGATFRVPSPDLPRRMQVSVAIATIGHPHGHSGVIDPMAQDGWAVPFEKAPAVGAAADALLAEALAADIPTGRPPHQPALKATSAVTASSLFHCGNRVQGATLDIHGPHWATRSAHAIAVAAAELERCGSRQDIEQAFITQALRYAIGSDDDAPDAGGNGDAGKQRGVSVSTAYAAALDRVAQLRFSDSPQSRELAAALDAALKGPVGPRHETRTRRIADRVVQLVAEMAAEKLARDIMGDSAQALIAACDQGDADGIGTTLTRLYRFDRSFGGPHQSSTARLLACLKRLPLPVQRGMIDVVLGRDEDGHPSIARRNLQAFLDTDAPSFATRPGDRMAAPSSGPHASMSFGHGAAGGLGGNGDPLAAALRRDQTDFLAALREAVSILAAQPWEKPLPNPRTLASVRNMPKHFGANRGVLRSIAQRLRSWVRPTVLDRARRDIADAVKAHAADKALSGQQWKALGRAMHDLDILHGPAAYADIVQDTLRGIGADAGMTLHLTVRRMGLMVGATDLANSDPTFMRHIATLDAALTKEVALRNIAVAVKDLVDTLPAHMKGPQAVQCLQRLSLRLKEHAQDTPEALALCRAAISRLGLGQDKIKKALARSGNFARQKEIKDMARHVLGRTMPPGMAYDHTIRMLPALQTLGAALEHELLHRQRVR